MGLYGAQSGLSELDRAAEKSARGSIYLFMGNFVSEIINAVGVFLVARLLTPEEYGIYNVAFVLPFLFKMFSNWGVGETLKRFLARAVSDAPHSSMTVFNRVEMK